MKKNKEKEKHYWDRFYNKWNVLVPSQFCALVATEIESSGNLVLEFGCGNGRDTIYFAERGFTIVAVDQSSVVINKDLRDIVSRHFDNVAFLYGDAGNEEDIKLAVGHSRDIAEKGKHLAVYARFFLHALSEEQEQVFLRVLSKLMLKDERIYFEFRSIEDEESEKVFGNHYRRFIDTPLLIAKLTNEYGFEVEYSITGKGMAKFKEEDPYVSRVIARKK